MLRTCKLLLTAIVALGLSADFAAAPLYAQGKGKPGGGGSNPPPPPVTYALKVFDMPTIATDYILMETYNMTSTGVVVGYFRQGGPYQPFLYDPSIDPDMAINLNDLGVAGLPEGWRIVAAIGVNEYGFVVGAIEEIAVPDVYRGYLLDLNADPPLLQTLPDGPGHAYARGINDCMDIVGVARAANGNLRGYVFNPLIDLEVTDLGIDLDHRVKLSNPLPGFPAQVTGVRISSSYPVFRYTIESGELTDLFATNGDQRAIPRDISPTGVVCGGYPKPKTKNGSTAFRYDSALEVLSDVGAAGAINSQGDLAMLYERSLYHEGTGLIDLTKTLTGSADDLDEWNSATEVVVSGMTERGAVNPDVPNFPGICGKITKSGIGSRGFILIPVAP
jgi:hypothetical protein